MRKHLPAIMLGLLILLLSTSAAKASEAEWQIRWQEDGTLEETVIVSSHTIQNVDSTWERNSTGDQEIFSRTIKNWQEYNRLKDKLPLEVNQSNYVFCNVSEIKSGQKNVEGTLYANLLGVQTMSLKIEVPGMIRVSSAQQVADSVATWDIQVPGKLFSPTFFLKTITLDGLMLGISILSLGVIIMFIFFVGRMRRVDRIIAETYSLDNINIEDDEDEPDLTDPDVK